MDDADYVPYSEREEWADVTPIPLEDGQVVQIAYSDKFRDIYGYFRAILSTREISERAFKLTEDAAILNPANYTMWNFRRILLKELKKDLWEEMDFIEQLIENHLKNYQVWFHRQTLVEWLNDPSRELKYTEYMIMHFDDPKNYHAWQHRQWVLETYSLWDDELEFTDQMLKLDVRNNSAWNHRFFVLPHFPDRSKEDEIMYTLEKIKLAPHNESSWNYLRGLLQDTGLSSNAEVKKFVDDLYDQDVRSPHLLGFKVDLLEEQILQEGSLKQKELLAMATELTQSLATEYDTVRKEYWKYVEKNLLNLYLTT